jgi:hypothetical protein
MRVSALLQAMKLELLLEHFATGLGEQQVFGIVFTEHVEEQFAGRLQVTRGFVLPGVTLEDQTGHAGDLAELAAGHLRCVDAGQQVLGQLVRGEQRAPGGCVEFGAVRR